VTTVTPDARLSEARDVMAEQRIRRLPVLKDGELVGIVSLGDVALADASKRAVGETLEEVSESPSTVDRNDGPDLGMPERVREAADRDASDRFAARAHAGRKRRVARRGRRIRWHTRTTTRTARRRSPTRGSPATRRSKYTAIVVMVLAIMAFLAWYVIPKF
jgi:cobalamin biosynthesis Mg chelatase CobN